VVSPVVAVWRSGLLSASETFVRNQGTALNRWRPVFVGATKIESVLAEDRDVIAFPDGRGFLRLRVTGRSQRLREVLAGVRPSLVHAHFGGDGWLIARTAADLGIPLVVTVHGHDVTRQPATPGLKGLRYRRNLRQVFDRATLVVAVSGFIRDRAVELGADPAKVRVHHIGVRTQPVPAAVAKEWDVVFVGRFVEKKGAGDLIEALGAMGRCGPRTVLIGDGPLAAGLRARAAELGIDATFLGVQDPASVARHLAASKILVAPSRTAADGDCEGLPMTILEAASAGLPVVATHHSGIPEAVLHGETGLLGAEGDRAALARNIEHLLADEALRERLGGAAREHVAARFDLARQTAVLAKIYDEALVRGSRP
jgi:colanic acid/amylovoran biosynthesis glycosyltransferase